LEARRNGRWRPTLHQGIGGWSGNEGGTSNVIFIPGHADPGYEYLFNDCVPGKGFSPVRIALEAKLKNSETKQIVAQEAYILKVSVSGKCRAAKKSRQIAEKQMAQNYGS
jgi:hypothetical protein